MKKLRYASLAGTAAVIMLTAACGGSGGDNAADPAAPAGAAADATYGSGDYGGGRQAAGAGAQSAQQAAGELAVRKDTRIGDLVTDSRGFTLYRFDNDSHQPPQSNCDGDCAVTWPPVPAGDVSAAAGLDESLLGEVARADGTKQLTLGGWPLYRYNKDVQPGQTKGEGVGGTWFAVAPDGKKASAAGAGAGTGAGGGAEAEQPADLPGLSVRNDPELGRILQDGEGHTVYLFTKDSRWPMKSNCLGECLEKWTPVAAVEKNDVEGVDPKLVTPFARPDGTRQASVDCWLLYTFSGDEAPGDIKGQGVGGTWFAVTPDGKKAKAA
ncbi:SCO0930 family lipoprotein [Streptomyces capparidis]